MSRSLVTVAALLLLLAPFREGGRDPLALLILHALVLLFVMLAGLRAAGAGRATLPTCPARRVAGLGAAAILLAAISALRAAYPLAAGLGLLDLAVAAGLFLAALCCEASARDLLRLRFAAVLSTALQAALALGRLAAGGGTKAAGAGFLNPNHLAAFLNVGLLLSAAAADQAREDGDRRAARRWAGCAALHLLAVGILASRGALLGLGAALSLLALLRFRSWPRGRRAAALVPLALAILVAGGFVAHRFARWRDPLRYQRVAIWRASGAMLAERPLLGHGPGMFRHLSARHTVPLRQGPIRLERRFAAAHSAPLTLAVEIGLPAAACLLAAAALAIALLLRPGPGVPPGMGRGLGLALAALVAHAAVEDLQERPALVLMPALLVGAALGAARSGDGGGALGRRDPGPAARAAAILLAAIAFVGAVLLPYLADREARAALQAGAAGLRRMERAATLNPLHPDYRHDLAMAALNSGPPTPERYAQAATWLLEARKLKPIDPRFPLLLARLEAAFGGALFADPTAGTRAAALYREAAALAPLDPLTRLELAGHLMGQGRRDEALEAARAALRLEPHFVRARVLEASLLLDLGRDEEARVAYRGLLATRDILRSFTPESRYAGELVRDAPEERRALEERLGVPAGSVDKPPSRDYIPPAQVL